MRRFLDALALGGDAPSPAQAPAQALGGKSPAPTPAQSFSGDAPAQRQRHTEFMMVDGETITPGIGSTVGLERVLALGLAEGLQRIVLATEISEFEGEL